MSINGLIRELPSRIAILFYIIIQTNQVMGNLKSKVRVGIQNILVTYELLE